MDNATLIPHLFRTEYRKITTVLCRLFGISNINIAEDIASDSFLEAAETWGLKGLPENPVAWIYAVAKNKAKDYLRRQQLFDDKILPLLRAGEDKAYDADLPEIDLSEQNIRDSQLRMMFAICHPVISTETQVGLSLSILCGFGVTEIAEAFLTNPETIYKRLSRGKEKLRQANIDIEMPPDPAIPARLSGVLTALYLLFNEGYHSHSGSTVLRKELCFEAMRLLYSLTEFQPTDLPEVRALLALMCFHASRFEARITSTGHLVLYEEQDVTQWDQELIARGVSYLDAAGLALTRYHLEAGIAFWHTQVPSDPRKWPNILLLYNELLKIHPTPVIEMNRAYALSKTGDHPGAIEAVERSGRAGTLHYHVLLGKLYEYSEPSNAKFHYAVALGLANSNQERNAIERHLERLSTNCS